MSLTCGAGRLNGGLRCLAFARYWRRLDFLSELSLFIERLMLPAEALRACNFVVMSRIVLWQHVGVLWLFGGITKETLPASTETRTRNSELVCPTASH